MKLMKSAPPTTTLSHLASGSFRQQWEALMLLSLSIDGFLFTMRPDQIATHLWLRLAIYSYLIGYLFGIAPILVKKTQQALGVGSGKTSTLAVAVLVITCSGAIIVELALRILSASQNSGRGAGTIFFVIAIAGFQLIKSREEIKKLINSRRSSDALIPVVEQSLCLTYLISITLFRSSLALTALTIISGEHSTVLYGAIWVMILVTCILIRSQEGKCSPPSQ